MNPLFEAAWEIHQFLTKENIHYVIIGGFALQNWGDLRITRDIELTISTQFNIDAPILVDIITSHFPSRIPNPIDFAHNTRMILIKASNGVHIDISVAFARYIPPFHHGILCQDTPPNLFCFAGLSNQSSLSSPLNISLSSYSLSRLSL